MLPETIAVVDEPPVNEQGKIVNEIERRFQARFNADEIPAGACFYWAHFTAEVLTEHGRTVLIQAGDMLWLSVSPEYDDGESPTHFGYQWEPESAVSRLVVQLGALPEVHVWCGLPTKQEIVDLSTRGLLLHHRRLLGSPWLAPRPPRYLWTRELPDGVHYTPRLAASVYVMQRLWDEFKPSYLTAFGQRLEAARGQSR